MTDTTQMEIEDENRAALTHHIETFLLSNPEGDFETFLDCWDARLEDLQRQLKEVRTTFEAGQSTRH